MRPRRATHARQYRAGTLPARHCHDDGGSYHKRLWRLASITKAIKGGSCRPFLFTTVTKKRHVAWRHTQGYYIPPATLVTLLCQFLRRFATLCDALRRFSKNTNTNSHLQATKRLAFFVTPCDICHKASQNALRRPPPFSSKIATFRTFLQSLKKPINDRIAGGR
jgi:ribosomal protein S21